MVKPMYTHRPVYYRATNRHGKATRTDWASVAVLRFACRTDTWTGVLDRPMKALMVCAKSLGARRCPVEPAEQSGQGNPESQDNPLNQMAEADVEQVLGELEQMTSKLSKQVGAVETSDGQAQDAERATESTVVNGDAQPASSNEQDSPDSAQPQSQTSDPSQPTQEDTAPETTTTASVRPDEQTPSDEAKEPTSASDADHQTSLTKEQDPHALPELAEAESEIDRELQQALSKMKSREAEADPVEEQASQDEDRADQHETPKRPTSALMRTLRGLTNKILVAVMVGLAIVNLPFRGMPVFARQILGYVAIGTAATATALWLYILLAAD